MRPICLSKVSLLRNNRNCFSFALGLSVLRYRPHPSQVIWATASGPSLLVTSSRWMLWRDVFTIPATSARLSCFFHTSFGNTSDLGGAENSSYIACITLNGAWNLIGFFISSNKRTNENVSIWRPYLLIIIVVLIIIVLIY